MQVVGVSEPFYTIVVLTLLSALLCLNIVYFLESQEPGGISWEKEQLKIPVLYIHSVALSNSTLHKINDLMELDILQEHEASAKNCHKM